MRTLVTIIFALLAFISSSLLFAQISFAEDFVGKAILSTGHQHTFVSVPKVIGTSNGVYFQVCNNSGKSSAFYWPGAGFGIDAPDELTSGLCATFEDFTGYGSSTESSDVQFQGGGKTRIEHWMRCRNFAGIDTCGGGSLDSWARVFTELSYFGKRADESNVTFTQARLGFSFERGESPVVSEFNIYATSNVRDMLIVFGNPKIDREKLRSVFQSDSFDFVVDDLSVLISNVGKKSDTLLEGLLPNFTALQVSARENTESIDLRKMGGGFEIGTEGVTVLLSSGSGVGARVDLR